ncbi:hypothetical protein D9M71_67220 [compost metagenome]
MITRESLARFEHDGVVLAAKALRRSTRTINRLAKSLGVEFQTHTDVQRARWRRQREKMAGRVRALARQRLTQAQICAELGITRAVLRHIAAEHHIDINSRSLG